MVSRSKPAPGTGVSRVVNMPEAKTHLSRLVEAIESGAEAEVVIARNGRPVARLTSLQAPQRARRLGIARGQFVVPHSIDAANPLITHQANGVFLSHVSLWEIAITHSLVRADMPLSAREAIPWAEQSGLEFLPIGLSHLLALEQRPLHPAQCR